jgi:hypothetical protein
MKINLVTIRKNLHLLSGSRLLDAICRRLQRIVSGGG